MSIKRKDVEFNLTFLEAMELACSGVVHVQGNLFKNGVYLTTDGDGRLIIRDYLVVMTKEPYMVDYRQLRNKFRAFQVAHQAVIED